MENREITPGEGKERREEAYNILDTGWISGGCFLKALTGDPVEVEDHTGERYDHTAIDCLVLYCTGVQEAIKTLCRRDS